MGRKFSLQIRYYVIQERGKDTSWKKIRDGIEQRFNVKAPTTRMMQKWLKETDREKLSQMLVEESKKKIPQAGAEAVAYFQQNILPTLWTNIDLGNDIAKICCMWMMGLTEQTFGAATFEKALQEYRKLREIAKAVHAKSWYEAQKVVSDARAEFDSTLKKD